MQIEVQMFARIEDYYKQVTFEYDTRHVLSIKTDEMMNSVPNSFHYVDMTGYMAYLPSEILSFMLCKPAKRVQNTSFQIAP